MQRKEKDNYSFNDDADPEWQEENTIFERILQNYDNKENLFRTQHHLQETLRSGALVCLICIDNVERNDYVWSCEECFSCFHLDCIQKWAKDSIFLQKQVAEDNGHRNRTDSLKNSYMWSCPKCRSEYAERKTPQDYKCFCGKVKNPSFDPWLIPHSCGEKCKKKLLPECGHTCLLLCHPGPCPPCPVMVKSSCFCNSSSATRRCASKFWSCQKQCNKLLDCEQHKCKSVCHDGSCPTCPRVSLRKCLCGSTKETRPCSELNWQCGKVCGKKYSCGHHICEAVCHKGDCGECPKSQERTCPCGKQASTLPCTETIPSCGDTCAKSLLCEIHSCAERCHRGPCPPCLQVLVKKCQCGLREKELPCSKTFTCDIKCKRIRDCKKHACNRKCCTGDCPPCEHTCGKTLGCGQHKCESRCHRGRCFPCSITHTISCTCGKTSVTVPCGRERKTPLPRCDARCRKSSNCHHKVREAHRCHEGPCPPCKLECDLLLDCGHKCLAKCHDAVSVRVAQTHKPAGPWEKAGPIMKISKLPCPPCKVVVSGTCFGNHETTNWACSDLRPHSCGQKCGRQLSCSHHTCEMECHVVEGAVDDVLQGANCQPCERPCMQKRPVGCNHRCKRRCHPSNCNPCQEKVHLQCHCSLLKLAFVCHIWLSTKPSSKEKMQSCGNQCSKVIECGHLCQKTCHSGDCSSAKECCEKVTVHCPCRRLRKEVPCHLVLSQQNQLDCTKACSELKERKKTKNDYDQMKKEKEEEEKRKKELEDFERFITGKKRKRKKEQIAPERDRNITWKTIYIVTSFLVVGFSVIYYIYV